MWIFHNESGNIQNGGHQWRCLILLRYLWNLTKSDVSSMTWKNVDFSRWNRLKHVGPWISFCVDTFGNLSSRVQCMCASVVSAPIDVQLSVETPCNSSRVYQRIFSVYEPIRHSVWKFCVQRPTFDALADSETYQHYSQMSYWLILRHRCEYLWPGMLLACNANSPFLGASLLCLRDGMTFEVINQAGNQHIGWNG